MNKFKSELERTPKLSGCYIMYNNSNVVIYVGKAKILFNRLKSYFNGRVSGKTKKMVSEIDHFEYIVTDSEVEAFILELNLIKKYDPKYNILLRDDKSYPYIEFTNEKYPRILVKRQININKKNTHLFGPYPNSYAARRLVNLIGRLYPLKKCDNMPKKVCLYYHIGECLGYCINKNINDDNMKIEILSILGGNDKLLINKIKEKIELNSQSLNYEVCKNLVEELKFIEITFNVQHVELNDNINRDIFNYYYNNYYMCVMVFFIRNGKLVGKSGKVMPIINSIKEDLEYFIVSFYSKNNILPKEIIVPSIVDNQLLNKILDVKIINVKRGNKKKLFLMAYENAKINYENEIKKLYNNEEKNNEANDELKRILNLNKLSIIEAFDNSNLFGNYNVSGMVCFIDGIPYKKGYRKFKLSKDKNDDVNSMKEVIYRRYYRALISKTMLPDLIIVDGGINQINACKSTLNELNLDIKVIGVQKDNTHTPKMIIDENNNVIHIDNTSKVFLLLSRIDEEVHRFTINYHKDIRSKGFMSSALDNIEGLGKVRKQNLIKKYSTINKIKNTTIEELSQIIPYKVAIKVKEKLK